VSVHVHAHVQVGDGLTATTSPQAAVA
jgi:hypothetical protein